MTLNYRKIGENLAKRRKELKLKQYEVCERADINYKYLSNIETARSIPSLEVFIRLCKALETTPNHILNGISINSTHSVKDDIMLEKFHSLSSENQHLCLDFLDLLFNKHNP
ncbi:MAG: helix-turn-helix transcriptional regulator [Ruminococcus sp.]|nr:helix-turn-helix transcriptional regulator [Ruminococcus sp.]